MQIGGRVAAITGAGSGLGRATARALHAAGARVLLVDIKPREVGELANQLGDGALAASADVRRPEEVKAAFDLAAERFAGLDIAVNCAGIASSAKIFSKGEPHDLELWRRVLDVNLTGTFNVMRYAVASMAGNHPDPETGERGIVVNTASVAAFDGQKGQIAYAASKAGIVGMTLPAARDLADRAIRCVAIAPGLFETELFQQIPEKGISALKRALLYPDRMGQPTEFSALVRHIIENPYINGTCFRLDGGARLPA
jgi:NAD(P)-dependent dehydrogenase (short-subunit alcohol dehydrogenase family)